MWRIRGCGSKVRRPRFVSSRQIERLETRSVLSSTGVAISPTTPGDAGRHGSSVFDAAAAQALNSRNYGPAADGHSPSSALNDFVSFTDFLILQNQSAFTRFSFAEFLMLQNAWSPGSDGSAGDGTRGDSHPSMKLPIFPAETLSTQAGRDSTDSVTAQHLGLDIAAHEPSSQAFVASSPVADAAANQSAYPAVRTILRSAGLTEDQTLVDLIQLVRTNLPIVKAGGSAVDADARRSAAPDAELPVYSAIAGMSGTQNVVDFVHSAPLVAEIPLNLRNVQHALDTVMTDIKLLGSEVSQWLGGTHFTQIAWAVTAATAGAGAAIYLRRRGGQEAGQRDDEDSSTWLFARLQSIPLEG